MDIIDDITEQSVQKDLTEINNLKESYEECIANVPKGKYRFIQLNKQRTIDDFCIEKNPHPQLCLPDLDNYKPSINLYVYNSDFGSGVFLINRMPKKKILSMPDCVSAYGKNIYWWGLFDMGLDDLCLATRKMAKDISVSTLSSEEIDTAQKITRLVNAVHIQDSPYVWNIFEGDLVL